ncbi:MAG: hypothetical protein KA419_20855 [Acidobacteria bacterium]|nr:hypothetical protein [Acidobacteriota bacterium]
MKHFLCLIALGALLVATLAAQQYEREETVQGRNILTLSETTPPLFRLSGFETDGLTGGTKIVLKDIRSVPELIALAQSGVLEAQDGDGTPRGLWLLRECFCQDGTIQRVNLNVESRECDSACDGHDGASSQKLSLLVTGLVGCGFELAVGQDPDFLVLIE